MVSSIEGAGPLVSAAAEIVTEVGKKGAITLRVGIDDEIGSEDVVGKGEDIVVGQDRVEIFEALEIVSVGQVGHLPEIDEGTEGGTTGIGGIDIGVKKGRESTNSAKKPDAVASGASGDIGGSGLQVGEEGVVTLPRDNFEKGLFAVLEQEELLGGELAAFLEHVAIAVGSGGITIGIRGAGALEGWGTNLRFDWRVVKDGFDGDGVAVGRCGVGAQRTNGC